MNRQTIIEELEKKKGLSSNPDFFIRLRKRLSHNMAMKNIDDFQFTQISWEAKDLMIEDILSIINK